MALWKRGFVVRLMRAKILSTNPDGRGRGREPWALPKRSNCEFKMTALLLSVLVAGSAQSLPAMPAGSSRDFQSQVLAVAQATQDGHWEDARKLADRLPTLTPRVLLDESKVPTANRVDWIRAINQGLGAWTRRFPEFVPRRVTSGPADVVITFLDRLPVPAGAELPAGMVTSSAPVGPEPALEAVIAKSRLNPPTPIDSRTLANEASFLMGRWLGLERAPALIGAMGRTDGMASWPPEPTAAEVRLARQIQEYVKQIRAAVNAKAALTIETPQLFVSVRQLDYGKPQQGERIVRTFDVTNNGQGELTLRLQPDCSCFAWQGPASLGAGETGTFSVQMDTTEFIGEQSKSLYLYSNDPDAAVQVITVGANITPAFRVIAAWPSAPNLYLDETSQATFYLFFPEDRPLTFREARVSGISGVADLTPWEGELADPLMKEAPRRRKGYRIDVLLNGQQVTGRINASLIVESNDPNTRTIFFPFAVQKGIAALPQSIFLGDVTEGPVSAWTQLSRPGRPFQVTAIECDDKRFRPSFSRLANGDWRINVEFDASGPIGQFVTVLRVRTDDPNQGLMEIMVQGTKR